MAMSWNGLGYEGLRVVVTGCASGMGEATARILGELGAEVVAVDVTRPTVPHAAYHETDLRDPAAIDATVAAIAAGEPVARLFNCAGIPHTFGPLDCMLVNYVGLRYLTDELLPHIVDGGAVATISSGAGMGYLANMATVGELLAISDPHEARAWCEAHPKEIREGYSFSKECLIVWTMQTAVAWGEQRRIRTNCIAPGPTDTAFMVPTVAELGRAYFDAFPYPTLGRMATATEQAWPLVLLSSEVMGVVSGTVLYSDQGMAAGFFTGTLQLPTP
jgi:NAD(P)-dependent dehydrogenase (short-subunit alcohol dehydrogenase family)